MIQRGAVFWVDLGPPVGSTPGKRRPVLVVQADPYNASRLASTLVVVLTTHNDLAELPGNVFLPSTATGLRRDSTADVTALVTLDKDDLREQAGQVPAHLMQDVSAGLRRVLGL